MEMVMIETEYYEIDVDLYHKVAWYAEQMGVTVDYYMDEYVIDDCLYVPEDLTPYDYEEMG